MIPVARDHLGRARPAGFTLVELAIVLIVVGLIAGGVLAGNSLISMARNQKLIQESRQFEIGVRAFALRVDCLPGDCPRADGFGLGHNGNGNQVLDGLYGGYENFNSWRHLSSAGLIRGEYPGDTSSGNPYYPSLPCNFFAYRCYPFLPVRVVASEATAGWMLVSQTGQTGASLFSATVGSMHLWVMGNPDGGSGGNAVLRPAQAFFVDSKMDDGHPMTGIVMARDDFGYYHGGMDSGFGPADAVPDEVSEFDSACVSDLDLSYNVADPSGGSACSLTIQLQ